MHTHQEVCGPFESRLKGTIGTFIMVTFSNNTPSCLPYDSYASRQDDMKHGQHLPSARSHIECITRHALVRCSRDLEQAVSQFPSCWSPRRRGSCRLEVEAAVRRRFGRWHFVVGIVTETIHLAVPSRSRPMFKLRYIFQHCSGSSDKPPELEPSTQAARLSDAFSDYAVGLPMVVEGENLRRKLRTTGLFCYIAVAGMR